MNTSEKLIESIKCINEKKIRKYAGGGLFSKSAGINYRDEQGDTPLHLAVSYLNSAMVEYLISKGADPSITNNEGMTPIFRAIDDPRRLDNLELLISKGADMNIRRSDGMTPLIYAIEKSNLHAAIMLMKCNADIGENMGYISQGFRKALSWDDDVAAYFINHGVDVNIRFEDGTTPLFHAQSKKIISILIAKGADVNANTRLFNVADDPECIRLLLYHGANPNTRNYEGSTVLSEIMKSPN